MDGPSEGKATDGRTGSGIRQKAGLAKRVPPQSARSLPKVSARSVSETNGMAFAARWQIVIRWLSRQLSHHLSFSSARLTHVTSLGWQAIPMFEQLKFSPAFVVHFVSLVLLRVSQNLR